MKRILASLVFIMLSLAARAQAPPDVPGLPDQQRLTSYSISNSTCACAVNFALYGDGTDFQSWVEVWINGILTPYNSPSASWKITSPTGALGQIPLPITDAKLTFASPQTGTIQIVGARRPRRISQFRPGQGVTPRDLNETITDIIAQNRETWDKINDVTGRALIGQPGMSYANMPLPTMCATSVLGFDASGLTPLCVKLPIVVTPFPAMTVPSEFILAGLSTTAAALVYRMGYYAAGDGGDGYYLASSSPCSLNAGAGDGGSQVPSFDGKCWLLLTSSNVKAQTFGATCNGTTNDSTAVANALAYGAGVTFPNKSCLVGNLVTANNQNIWAYGTTFLAAPGSNWTLKITGNRTGLFGGQFNDAVGGLAAQTTTTASVVTTVTAATIAPNMAGSGGTPGACTLTGTTGTGTPFQATGTVDGSGALTSPVAISAAGSYTVFVDNLSGEPVTSNCSLTGVQLALTPSTTVPVTSAAAVPGVTPAFQGGQVYAVRGADGLFQYGMVYNSAANVLTLSTPPASSIPSGASIWASFGQVYVNNSTYATIRDLQFSGWEGMMLDNIFNVNVHDGVTFTNVRNINVQSGRIFGFVKGRNVNSIQGGDLNIWGGFGVVDNFTGDGGTTTFFLSQRLRKVPPGTGAPVVTVNGVTQTYNAAPAAGQFSIASGGLSITFGVAPANSAAIVVTYISMGAVGFLDIARSDGVYSHNVNSGGNNLTDVATLQWDEGTVLDTTFGLELKGLITDANIDDCLRLDNTSQSNVIYGSVYFCIKDIHAMNGATGVIADLLENPQPTTIPVGGAAGTRLLIDSGSGLTYTLHDQIYNPGIPDIADSPMCVPSISAQNGANNFVINTGSGACGGGSSATIDMPGMPNGYNCYATDETAPGIRDVKQTLRSGVFPGTNQVAFGNYDRTTGLATPWQANHLIDVTCSPW